MKKDNKNKEKKKYNLIACNNCHKTNVTLIKAKDSYYCKFCFEKLGKERY